MSGGDFGCFGEEAEPEIVSELIVEELHFGFRGVWVVLKVLFVVPLDSLPERAHSAEDSQTGFLLQHFKLVRVQIL